MTTIRNAAAASLAALLFLSACETEPEVLGERVDPQAEALENAPPVELPPSIRTADTYRCRDNSLVHITYLTDDKTAMIRESADTLPIATLKAPEAGEPFVSEEGYRLEGSGETVTYKAPGEEALTCRSS